jgi:hypothetical protein
MELIEMTSHNLQSRKVMLHHQCWLLNTAEWVIDLNQIQTKDYNNNNNNKNKQIIIRDRNQILIKDLSQLIVKIDNQ